MIKSIIMKLIKMQCPNCNAALDIDIEKLQAYCPYCGTKLLFDLDQLNQIITEKEKTKRYQIEQEASITKAKIQRLNDFLKNDAVKAFLFLMGLALYFLLVSLIK